MRELDACGIGFVADAHGRPSRQIVDAALRGLANVKHRGAVAADALTSDGTGLLTTIPAAVYGEGTGVAALFVRGDDPAAEVEAAAAAEGLEVVDWRTPPTDESALGALAAASRPTIVQALLRPTAETAAAGARLVSDGVESRIGDVAIEELERRTFRMRRRIDATTEGTYVVSCSFRTIVHKGLVAADALSAFYLDLADERFESHLAVFHQRFSTNTLPTWERAQPFRMLCHNGEINTIGGNENRMRARSRLGTLEAGLGPEDLFRPVIEAESSDSGMLDQAAELLLRGGRHLSHAMAMLVPEAWEETRDLDPEVRGFYEYHSALMEPWDGPAGVIFTDGVRVGAVLDRNGLRPLRYAICDDGLVVCASEMGAVEVAGHGTVDRGRLGPGHMLVVSPSFGVVRNSAVKEHMAAEAPYAQWADDGFLEVPPGEPVAETPTDLLVRQAAQGYTREELAMVLKPMAADAYEPTFAMGDDSPLPPMAGRARPVAHFLRQRFAQVTNPPIDPLRERLVMSLRTLLGPRAPLLSEGPDAARLMCLESFFVFPSAVDALQRPGGSPFPVVRLTPSFEVDLGPAGLEEAVRTLADRAEAAVRAGAGVVIIDAGDPGPHVVQVPSLLALGAVHQRLTAARLRSDTSLVVVSDDARDTHSVAALLGYGADAVCPRLALQTVAAEADEADTGDLVSSDAQERLRAALEAGVLKILSKMGVSTVDSYRGAQLFEVIGLADEVVDVCFTGTANAVGGIGWLALGEDVLAHHAEAFPAGTDDAGAEPELESPGYYRVRKGGEYHAHSKEVTQALNELTLVLETPPVSERDPQAVDQAAAHLLQRAIAADDYDRYETFVKLVTERPPTELNDLLEWVAVGPPVPIDEVEPASEIARRFSTGAMSHGSLSKEAHETLAQAMNLIGGRSNCGEGGEDPARFHTRGMGRDDKNSRIKQVASGRFGVTPEYLAHADEIQIKMAQGSKPGEGGQLPGHKVSAEIARLRHTQPGVGLISPPPHHDIYSIEDLAQLIYDLKQVNAAQVSVKLVSTDNVGTIAAGVVKALADVVHISGGNGGTGASPLSAIKHAGMPWEIGLADTQRALVDNGLRGRVRLRVDGGFKTGRHVLVAALLGADEYSFGTAAMIAEGCIMLRACHRDTCKPGVATQRPHLRANFTGTPEGVAAYFLFVAEEVRRHLAAMGAHSIDELVGRVELLRRRTTGDARIDSFDLTFLTTPPEAEGEPRHFVERVGLQDPRSVLGDQLLADAFRVVWDRERAELAYPITNAERSVGTALSGAMALEFGTEAPRGSASVRFDGAAGQSFGAFLSAGVEMELVGEANDYVGKGMGGGLIAIRPPADDATLADGAAAARGSSTVLAGNTCLYGATGGELFVAGAVGERFAVRNSGAVAVVEAVGDHCCEYMTGGTVVVLGRIGYNLGAGMTGGQAFLWDPEVERVLTRVNPDLVAVLRPEHDDLVELRWLVERHAELTGSRRAAQLLDDWEASAEHLWHVVPRTRAETLVATAARRVATA
jgi:glutamate synthase domain-containing protein 2/glutamate synthase domain-containing protein 1/glutamate synthase domain-containing protein 3